MRKITGGKKPTAKKPVSRKPATRKAVSKTAPSKNVASKKPTVAKKPTAAKKTTANKPATTKTASKKVASKKPSTTKKPATPKTASKKVASKKPLSTKARSQMIQKKSAKQDKDKTRTWNALKSIPGKDPDVWRKDRYGNVVRYASYGTKKGKYAWELDHIKPKSKGGTDKPANLQALHRDENQKKSDIYPYKK